MSVNNPLTTAIVEAEELIDALREYADQLRLAIENEATKRRIAKEARQNYEALEAEVVAETLMNANGKNAEARKAELDAVLVKARATGNLARAWALMNATAYDAEDAKTGLEQAQTMFSACKHACDLKAMILRAASL